MASLCLLCTSCNAITAPSPYATVSESVGDLVVPATTDLTRNTTLRVEEGGSGGGNGCDFFPGTICAIVTLRTETNYMDGVGVSPFNPASPFNFSIKGELQQLVDPARVNPVGVVVGQFSTGRFDITVKNGVATAALTLVGPFDKDKTVSASGSAPAVQSKDPCRPLPNDPSGIGGFFMYTDMTLQLPHLGRTDINIWGWVGC